MIKIAVLVAVLMFAAGYGLAVIRVPGEADWLPLLGTLVELGGKLDWLNVLLIGSGFVVMALLVVAQFTAGDGFDMRSLLAQRSVVDGHEHWTVLPGRAYQFGGFLMTSWGFVVLITKGALSDLYLGIYAVAWLASPAINQIVASKYPVTPGTAMPPAP